MKKIIFGFAFLFSVLSVVTGFAQTREKRSVSAFTRVSFQVGGKLLLTQASVNSVELVGDKEVLEKIKTRVEGGKLIIGYEEEGSWFNWRDSRTDEKIVVYVSIKDIEGLYASGSGDIIAQTPLNGKGMEVKVSGSGSIQADISAADVEASVSGSGDLTLKGKVQSIDSQISGSGKISFDGAIAGRVAIDISGSGKFLASGTAKEIKTSIAGSGKVAAADLLVDRCDVRIAGSGDVVVNVQTALEANISGSGTVTYKGNPAQLSTHASGSGRIRKM